MVRLVGGVLRRLDWWWRGDRIRASPRKGRLLRLGPGWFVRLAGVPARVVRREVRELAVVYHCTAADGPCELHVMPTDAGLVITMRGGGRERTLAEDDVDAIPGPR